MLLIAIVYIFIIFLFASIIMVSLEIKKEVVKVLWGTFILNLPQH
jgi:hypothetical protein